MAALGEYVGYTYTTSEGRPIKHGGLTVTPLSRVLAIRLPFWGYIWNRPVGVRVDDGVSVTEIGIVDVTLLTQIGLVSLSLAASIVAFLFGLRRQS